MFPGISPPEGDEGLPRPRGVDDGGLAGLFQHGRSGTIRRFVMREKLDPHIGRPPFPGLSQNR